MGRDISWNRRRLRRTVALVAIVAGASALARLGNSSTSLATPPSPPLAFQKDVRPVLQVTCLKCHNATKHKGDVDLSGFTDDKSAARGRKVWRKAIEQIE